MARIDPMTLSRDGQRLKAFRAVCDCGRAVLVGLGVLIPSAMPAKWLGGELFGRAQTSDVSTGCRSAWR